MLEREQPLPQWFDEEPQILEGEEFYLAAFWDLSTERPVGWTSGPIPHHRIVEYGERCGLDQSTMSLFTRVVRAMDATYLEWVAAERKRLSDQDKGD